MAANEPEPTRLLSVQSHVVSGYVGNRSATFPLQLLGWDVDVINTVQFSNHTGYGRWQGQRFDEDHIRSLFAGLEKNGLLKQSRMLSGYMPSPGVVQAVLDAVTRIRQFNPELIYLCDPVMGDMGRGMYVDANVLPVYKKMLSVATIITPNQFEAEQLADEKITDIASLLSVIAKLHTQGVEHVIITSVDLPIADLAKIGADQSSSSGNTSATSSMILVGSSCPRSRTSSSASTIATAHLRPWFIQFPEIKGYFSGVGDLFSALALGHFLRPSSESINTSASASPIAKAAELAIASVQSVLARTLDFKLRPDGPTSGKPLPNAITSLSSAPPSALSTPIPTMSQFDFPTKEEYEAQIRVETMRRRELRIVQSQKEILNPGVDTGGVAYRSKKFPADVVAAQH